jgi:hypothetical protein
MTFKPLDEEDLGINIVEVEQKKSKIEDFTRFVIFGSDSRDTDNQYAGRSDSIIIVTINNVDKKISLISIPRDTYVDVPGYGMTKINHAFAYGQEQLSLKTINSNFGTDLTQINREEDETLKDLLPQDLLKFGLIPEFVGRLPIVATLKALDKQALLDIITKPKNSLVKQYKKLFEIDGVELEFEDEAIDAIVDKAIERKTGARGLRSIIEEIMTDIMFEIPSNPKIVKCTITRDTVINSKEPEVVIDESKEASETTTTDIRKARPRNRKETA